MFKNFLPNKILNINHKIINGLIILMLVIILIGIVYALFISPPDYIQGDSVRIMYVHVPSAWLSMVIFFIMTIYSIIALSFKIPFGFIVIRAVAPIGATFTLICLISGSLWGKPMWGTWWVWDARLTSVLILFLFYIVIIFFRNSFSNIEVGEKITAIFIIVGSINLPIIKFSVDWWNTLHQPASISKLSASSIDPSMLNPLIIMTFALTLIGLLIGFIRIRAEILETKHQI